MMRRPSAVAVLVILIIFLSTEFGVGIQKEILPTMNVPVVENDFREALEKKGFPEEIAPRFLEFLTPYLNSVDDVIKAREYLAKARRYGKDEYYDVAVNLLEISSELLAESISKHAEMIDTWKEREIFSKGDQALPELSPKFDEMFRELLKELLERLGYIMEYKPVRKQASHHWRNKTQILEKEHSLGLQESIHRDLTEMKETLNNIKNEIQTARKEGITPRPRWTSWDTIATAIGIGVILTVSIATACAGTALAIGTGALVLSIIYHYS